MKNLSLVTTVDLIIFCAEWCTACRELRISLKETTLPGISQLYWIDIEDTIFICDDLDIKNLPSIAIIKNQRVIFFGIIEPRISHFKFLLTHQLQEKQPSIYDAFILSIYKQLKNDRTQKIEI